MKTIAILILTATLVACGGREGRETIQNKGSDTLVNVAQKWAEVYKDKKPSVAVAVSGGGSGTGIAALINGKVDLANASRAMKPKEIEMAKKNGVTPVQHIVGYDALAVFLHPKNPIDTLTLGQLAEMYGKDGTFTTWSQLGVEFPEADKDKILLVGRQNNSGTYAYFRKTVLGKGDYKLGSNDMHGSKDVVEFIAETPGAIGYSGLAYATDHIKMAKIAKKEGDVAVAPSIQTALDGSYPIARPLFMYTRGEPRGEVKAYLDWILGPEGQQILLDMGYAPVNHPDAKK